MHAGLGPLCLLWWHALNVCVCVCLWARLQAYYPRIIESLNRSIKDNRSLLLLLPEDVVHGVKALRETMIALSKKLL